MTVYVDELKLSAPYADNRKWPYKYHCHMVADTLNELHEMADRIGMNPKWFQHNERLWMAHYDLTKNLRQQAKRRGAQEISAREWAKQHMFQETKS